MRYSGILPKGARGGGGKFGRGGSSDRAEGRAGERSDGVEVRVGWTCLWAGRERIEIKNRCTNAGNMIKYTKTR